MSSKKKGIYIRNKRIKHMSGPVSIHYLTPSDKHKDKNLPLVLLFGDIHGDFDNVCSSDENEEKKSKTYAIYDEKFIKLIDIEDVHFFVEDAYIHDSEKKFVFRDHDPIVSVFNIARNCYKRTDKCISKNIKWHYSDVRRVIAGDEKYKVLKSIDTLRNIIEDIHTTSAIETIRSSFDKFKEDFKSLIKKWLVSDSFVDFFTKENIYIKQEKKSELKLLNKLKTFYVKKEHELYKNYGLTGFGDLVTRVIEILNFIDEFLFLTQFDQTQFDIDLSEFLSKINTLNKVFLYLCSFMLDIYSLQRSFKYNAKLNIFYFGDFHINNMFEFLIESKLYKIEYTRENETKSLYNDGDDDDDFLMDIYPTNRCITIDEHVSIPI